MVASFTRETGNVWSNPELTCQHVDPQTSLPPGQDATLEVKILVLSRVAQQRSGESPPATQFLEIETFRVTGVSKGVGHAHELLQNQLWCFRHQLLVEVL